MTKQRKFWFLTSVVLSVVFTIFTITVKYVGTQTYGDQVIGLASLNLWWHHLIGVQNFWYVLSNVLALFTLATLAAVLAWQFVAICRRKSFRALPRYWWFFDLTLVILLLCYLLFQIITVNFRPVLVDGIAELSYPSSHVLFFATLWPVVLLTLAREVKSRVWLRLIIVVGLFFMIVGIVARTCSGYHWLTDILGGILLGLTITAWYQTLAVRYDG